MRVTLKPLLKGKREATTLLFQPPLLVLTLPQFDVNTEHLYKVCSLVAEQYSPISLRLLKGNIFPQKIICFIKFKKFPWMIKLLFFYLK
jgi:hypothetical protein